MKDKLHTVTDTLFLLVSTLEPRVKPLQGWFKSTVETLIKWRQSEGNQGVKRMKDILGRSFEIICQEKPDTPLSFVKQRDGVPVLAAPLVERCKSLTCDAKLLSAVLSLIRVTDLFVGNPTDGVIENQLKVINDHQMPPSAKRIISEFQKFVRLWYSQKNPHRSVGRIKAPFRITEGKEMHNRLSVSMWSTKSGPNGPLTMMSHRDLLSLLESHTSNKLCDSLADAIAHLSAIIVSNSAPGQGWAPNWFFPIDPDEYLDLLERAPKPLMDAAQAAIPGGIPHNQFAGKIGFKPEKGGKVRLIAMPDYYTQMVMQPIHKKLMNVLKTFEADCTFDQRSALPKICEWHETGKTICSFDQTSCTDLFPIDCQLTILSEAFDKSLTKALRTVMVDRDWEVKLPSGRTTKVRWSVGQPLGMFASWPLMAVTHHLLVQFAAWRASGRSNVITPFKDYVICGDDIVIASKSVSDSYLRVVSLLGMKVNLSKSHISGGKTGISPVSEFAKIVVWRGQPLNPVRPNLVAKAVQDWKYLVTLVQDLRLGVWRIRKDFVSRLIKALHPSKSKVLEYLVSVPSQLGGFGFRTTIPLKDVLTSQVDAEHIHPWILFLAGKIRSAMVLEDVLVQDPATRLLEEVGNDAYRYHPACQYLTEIMQRERGLRQIFRDEKVPSLREIACDLLEHGISNYLWYLQDSFVASPGPDWSGAAREFAERKQRVMWDKVLEKDITYVPYFRDSIQISGRTLQEVTYSAIQSYLYSKLEAER